MRADERAPARRGALGPARRGALGTAALLAALTTGVGTAGAAPLVDPAPGVQTRGVPVDRLPAEVTSSPPGGSPVPAPGSGPVVPPGVVLLGAGAGALVVLVLRQRRLAENAGPHGDTAPGLLTGTPALVQALAAALADDAEPVGLVLLRVDVPEAGDRSAAEEWAAADAVLQALDVAVPLVAEQVGLRARAGDGVVRLGMNRLAVVLPGSGAGEARAVADRLRAGVAAAAGPGLRVDVGSAGSPVDGTVPTALQRAAERSLRAAGARAAA